MNDRADLDREVGAEPFAHAAAGARLRFCKVCDLKVIEREAAFGAEFYAYVAALAPRGVDVELDRHLWLVRVGNARGEVGVEPQRRVAARRLRPDAARLERLEIDRSRFLRRQRLEHRKPVGDGYVH